jgi:hypothetical protein
MLPDKGNVPFALYAFGCFMRLNNAVVIELRDNEVTVVFVHPAHSLLTEEGVRVFEQYCKKGGDNVKGRTREEADGIPLVYTCTVRVPADALPAGRKTGKCPAW